MARIIAKILIICCFINIVLNFNCRINSNDKCSNNTLCNESGICVCEKFKYGENCDKILSDISVLNLNNGISSGSYLTIILCISLIMPAGLIVGFFLIFLFLKGRDWTYST